MVSCSNLSVQFSCSVVSDSETPWTAARQVPCPSPTSRACSNSCPLSQWCHPTISSSVVPFSSCPQIFPSIRVFSNESALHIRWPSLTYALLKCVLGRSPLNKIEINPLLFSHSEICGMGWAKMLHFCFRTQYCVSFLVLLWQSAIHRVAWSNGNLFSHFICSYYKIMAVFCIIYPYNLFILCVV